MNPDLLAAVRRMKQQGLSDTEITNDLATQYSTTEITVCLKTLKDMRQNNPDTSNTLPAPYQSKAKSGISKLYVGLLIMFGVVVVLLFLAPEIYRYLKTPYVNKLASTLSSNYDVDKSYDVGSTTDCTSQGPTQFGDVTGLSVCSLITAKVYYPHIKTETQTIQSYVDNDGHPVSTPIKEKEFKVWYADKQGKSIERYIQTGTPVKQFGQGNPYYVDSELNLTGFNHVVFSTIGFKPGSSSTLTAKNWTWGSSPSWLGHDTPGERLQKSIDKKIQSNQPPAKDAPTTTEALQKGTAPLVAYYIVRYCHQPNIPILDRFCVLPNLGPYVPRHTQQT